MAPRKDAATQGIAKLKRQHGNARRLYEQSSRAVEAALEQHARELTKELAKERAKSSGLLGQLKAANAKAGEGLRAELDAERKKISQVRAKLNEANAKLKAANDRGESLRVELDAGRKKSSEAQAKLKEAGAKLKTATDQCESLRAEVAKQRDNCAKMTAERDAERKKSADLENQLKQLCDKASPHAIFKGCTCLFAAAHNFDFRTVSDAGKTFTRGGVAYIRPTGSMRYALEIANRYDDQDWLTDDAGGWAVAYHGTSRENAVSIIRNGFHIGKGTRFQFGSGIYCTPDPDTAKTNYATDFIENGKTCRVIVQVRVKPRQHSVVWAGNGVQKEYWLVADPANIRPYGLCVYGI